MADSPLHGIINVNINIIFAEQEIFHTFDFQRHCILWFIYRNGHNAISLIRNGKLVSVTIFCRIRFFWFRGFHSKSLIGTRRHISIIFFNRSVAYIGCKTFFVILSNFSCCRFGDRKHTRNFTVRPHECSIFLGSIYADTHFAVIFIIIQWQFIPISVIGVIRQIRLLRFNRKALFLASINILAVVFCAGFIHIQRQVLVRVC